MKAMKQLKGQSKEQEYQIEHWTNNECSLNHRLILMHSFRYIIISIVLNSCGKRCYRCLSCNNAKIVFLQHYKITCLNNMDALETPQIAKDNAMVIQCCIIIFCYLGQEQCRNVIQIISFKRSTNWKLFKPKCHLRIIFLNKGKQFLF